VADGRPEVVWSGPADWARYRDVRLAALIDAPSAFGSTYEREASFDEATWRERAAGDAWLAVAGGRPVGIVGLYAAPGLPEGAVMLVAMWVAGEARGSGVADALVEAALAGAAEAGFAEVVLYVEAGNGRAAAFYERMGFTPADLPAKTTGNGLCERSMRRPLQ
jgi:ribosomal protein S18 acetylase RimI-like enzyme